MAAKGAGSTTKYTPENVDEVLRKLEAALAKVDQSQGSRVKLPKAELELLQQVEVVRDLLNFVRDNRTVLRDLFGDLARISRIKAVLDALRLSGQNAQDRRLEMCRKAVGSVEQLLTESEGGGAAVAAAVERAKAALSKRRSSIKPEDLLALQERVGSRSSKRDDIVPKILAVDKVEDLTKVAPDKKTQLGPWMIWMVHRLHLNDPTLTKLDFTNLQMPPCVVEKKGSRAHEVAPKLVRAVATNTHVEALLLSNSNLRGEDGRELGRSLEKNSTIRVLVLDSNVLDPADLEVIAQGLGVNQSVQVFQCNNQLAPDAGRSRNATLEALFSAVKRNTGIVKFGMHITEPYYLNEISRQVMANSDAARKTRVQTANASNAPGGPEPDVLEELGLSVECSDSEPEAADFGDESTDASTAESDNPEDPGADAAGGGSSGQPT